MSGRGRRRVLSHDERALWSAVTKAIKPLPAPLRGSSGADDELLTETPKEAHQEISKPRGAARPAKAAHVSAPKPVPPPTSLPPLGRRMKQRVARGKHAIDARLDLHGYTQSEAHAALLRFLHSARTRDARLVLVITGKGRGGEPGVLRRQVPQWLGLSEFRTFVIGFEDAHISHGGAGALYIRLRRSRGE